MSHAEAIQKNNDVLQRCTTINLYVIDFLGAKDVLDEAQESDLRAERSHLRQRILLFQWLKVVPSHRYESFLQVMKDAEQEHVANLLTGSTEGDHLPLSDARYARLRKIRHKMTEVTHIDSEVIAELRRSKAISMTDAEEIRAETVDYAKVSKLIGAIMRRSNYSYYSFEEVLRKTLQTAAAEFLSEGEMPAVHLNNNRPGSDGPLSLAFNDVIRNRTTDDTEIRDLLAEMNGLGLHPVRAIPGQSIVIFIYCKTVQNAVKFTQLFNSGRLQYILESILNRLLLTIEPHNAKTLDSSIKLEDEEVITLEEFTGIEGWMIESFKRQKLSGEIYGCDATTQTGSMIESFERQMPSGDKYGYDATTQTGRSRRRRKPRKRNKMKPNKYDPSSSAYADKGNGGKLQDMQDTDLEKPTSGAIIRSRAEPQWETLSPLSSVLSIATSQLADDVSSVTDMDRCCCCGGVNESKDRASGHVFDCQHFLCKNCLGTFIEIRLPSVCFACESPAVDSAGLPFDRNTQDSDKVKSINIGSIVGDCSTKRTVPAEFIYDRVQLEISDICLSGNRISGRTEAVGQSVRMEGKEQGPRKTSSGRCAKTLTDFALTLREKKNELEAAEKSFQEQGNQIWKDIEKHALMYQALIRRDENRLLQQLNETRSAILSENSAAISSIWSLMLRLKKNDDLDHEEETDEMEQLLTTRIKNTQFKDVTVYLNDICPPKDRNIVGELKFEPLPDHSSFLASPVLVGSIPDVRHQAVTGVTSLDREVFVTRDDSQDISVYSVMTNTFLRSLSLLYLLEPIVIPSPVDLAACHTTRTLYVADGSNNYVFRLRPDGMLVHWWPVENIRGLSVGTTGTILVGSGRAIREYDPSGKLVRTISTSSLGSLFRGRERPSMKHPTHFLETDNGRIVVCDFTDDRSPHVVYAVDRKGSAVTCWHGNRSDSGDEFLNEPRHLAIGVTGHVMVADRRNDRVKLLDADLKFVRDLMGAGQFFKRPQRLHYDRARGLLYIGLVAGDTLVFRVTL